MSDMWRIFKTVVVGQVPHERRFPEDGNNHRAKSGHD